MPLLSEALSPKRAVTDAEFLAAFRELDDVVTLSRERDPLHTRKTAAYAEMCRLLTTYAPWAARRVIEALEAQDDGGQTRSRER